MGLTHDVTTTDPDAAAAVRECIDESVTRASISLRSPGVMLDWDDYAALCKWVHA